MARNWISVKNHIFRDFTADWETGSDAISHEQYITSLYHGVAEVAFCLLKHPPTIQCFLVRSWSPITSHPTMVTQTWYKFVRRVFAASKRLTWLMFRCPWFGPSHRYEYHTILAPDKHASYNLLLLRRTDSNTKKTSPSTQSF